MGMRRAIGLGLLMSLLPAAVLAQTVPTQSPNGRVHAVLQGTTAVSPARVHAVYLPTGGQTAAPPPAKSPFSVKPPPPPSSPPPPPAPSLWPNPGPPRPERIVTITGGRINGQVVGDGTLAFKAIPFAAPPVGRLRWAPPQAVTPWQGVRDASGESAPACLQNDYGWQTDMAAGSSEDCLYLEVRTPTLDPGAKKPVIVWFHGGANRAGGGMGTISSALGGQDVVIVSVQYRLGVFGFLSHPALTKESGVGASGNYALMDQVKALQWVQANIAQFGGDPYNVTLVGHSAGAQDVGLLLVSPLARGLFQKAVEESGTPQFGFAARTLAQNEAMGVALAARFSHAAPDSAQALADLRAAPARDLQAAGDALHAPMEDQSFIWDQATVDGYVLPRAPEEVFRAGGAAKVPLIIGVSARELTLEDVSQDYDAALDTRFGASRGTVDAYDGHDDALYGDRVMQTSSDILVRCPADFVARHMAGPVYLYQLDVDHGGTIHHGSELNFVMNARPVGASDGEWPPLLDYWTQFARTGAPAGKGLAAWPVYGEGHRYIEFTPHGAVTAASWRQPVCALLNRP